MAGPASKVSEYVFQDSSSTSVTGPYNALAGARSQIR